MTSTPHKKGSYAHMPSPLRRPGGSGVAIPHAGRPIRSKEHPLDSLGKSYQAPSDDFLSWIEAKGASKPEDYIMKRVAVPGEKGCEATPLTVAAWNGDAATVDVLLGFLPEGSNVDVRDEDGATPFMRAVFKGKLEVARSLFDRGCDPRIKNHRGHTALHYAAMLHPVDVVSLIAEMCLEVERNDESENAKPIKKIFTAAAMQRLLPSATAGVYTEDGHSSDKTAGFQYNTADDDGGYTYESPSSILNSSNNHFGNNLAVDNDNIAQSVTSSARSAGSTPAQLMGVIDVASGKSNAPTKLVRLVSPSLDAVDEEGLTPLAWAALRGRDSVVKTLLATKLVDPSSRDHLGWTPLHHAVGRGHSDCARTLILAGSGITEVDGEGYAPIHRAAMGGSVACLRLTLADDTTIARQFDFCDSRDGDGGAENTDLRSRRQQLALDAVRLVSMQTRDGDTPMHIAAREGHPAVVRFLISRGADADGSASTRKSPLSFAISTGSKPVIMELLAGNAKVGPMELATAAKADPEIKRIVESGAKSRPEPGSFTFASAPQARKK